jgi:hypothetical protein
MTFAHRPTAAPNAASRGGDAVGRRGGAGRSDGDFGTDFDGFRSDLALGGQEF